MKAILGKIITAACALLMAASMLSCSRDIKSESDEIDEPGQEQGSIRVTTDGCEHIEPLEATLSCTVRGASEKAEVGFYLGFDPDFKKDTYRKIVAEEGYGKYYVSVNGIYGEQKYYYKSYVKDNGEEYFGTVKSFTSKPITYTINGKTYKVINIEDGPYGPYCIFQTELPANVAVFFGNNESEPMDMNSDGILSAYEFRAGMLSLHYNSGLPWRLPTIEEWQYAYKGGSKSKGYKYSGSNSLDNVAWYAENSNSKPHEIATKAPNELGLYDMSGNYSEPTDDGQIKYFYTHEYYLYAAINGYFLGNSYGGTFASSETGCRIDSKEQTKKGKDMMDANKRAIRFVSSIDPAFVPFKKK
ncbi:MAG: formylglycine-generating enzyme family protein [Muribaculaceae bacterium]|nr:formylglycine-generating enzyme family protein [Muribaculaceae bacterium]